LFLQIEEKPMATHDDLTVDHPVVSHEEWLEAR